MRCDHSRRDNVWEYVAFLMQWTTERHCALTHFTSVISVLLRYYMVSKVNLIICVNRLQVNAKMWIYANLCWASSSWKISTRVNNLHNALLRKPIREELIEMSSLTCLVVSEFFFIVFIHASDAKSFPQITYRVSNAMQIFALLLVCPHNYNFNNILNNMFCFLF